MTHAASALHDSLQEPAIALDIRRVAGRIGAEIRGVRLTADLDETNISSIKLALLKYKVLFFRGQQHLDDTTQEGLAQRFGELVAHPTVPKIAGTGHLLELDSNHGARANSWHTDVTFVEAYPKISILRAVLIPPYGGDTVWANTAAAYEHLPQALKDLADGLRALHTNAYDYAATHVDASTESLKRYREVFTSTLYETEHPVVHIHPETGERSLILGHFVQRLQGLSSSDSNHLLALFHDHITRQENTVRWNWTQGDVALWDNRATQHYAINDYGDAHRIVRRATVQGEVPIGVDGRRSVALKPSGPAKDRPRHDAVPPATV